jgi:low affinity Fe/Cu permease
MSNLPRDEPARAESIDDSQASQRTRQRSAWALPSGAARAAAHLKSPGGERVMKKSFRKFAEQVAWLVGTPWAFALALGVLIVWAASGPYFAFSEQWQLSVNSLTTIVTFLMVFLIQNTQNRDFKSLQLKLDILLSTTEDAHPGLVSLHHFSDEDLHRLERALKRKRGDHAIEDVIESLTASNSN